MIRIFWDLRAVFHIECMPSVKQRLTLIDSVQPTDVALRMCEIISSKIALVA